MRQSIARRRCGVSPIRSGDPRRSGHPGLVRAAPDLRGVPGAGARPGRRHPTGIRPGGGRRAPDRDGAAVEPDRAAPLPQRLLNATSSMTDADPDHRLGIRRDGRPVLRSRQLQHQPRADADEDEVLLDRLRRRGAARPARPADADAHRVDFREAMWGVLQQGVSTLDVDFVAYATAGFDRLLANAAAPRFEQALDEVARG